MSIQRIAARYAKALIDLAQDRDALGTVIEDVQSFSVMCDSSRDFRLLLKSPIIDTYKKRNVFKRLFEGSINEITYAFFDIILRKGREEYLQEIALEFAEQYREIRKIAAIGITTATALDDNQLAKIRDTIAGSGMTYENVELTSNVDPNIIGGFIIEFEDKLYDASVSHQLDEARKAFS